MLGDRNKRKYKNSDLIDIESLSIMNKGNEYYDNLGYPNSYTSTNGNVINSEGAQVSNGPIVINIFSFTSRICFIFIIVPLLALGSVYGSYSLITSLLALSPSSSSSSSASQSFYSISFSSLLAKYNDDPEMSHICFPVIGDYGVYNTSETNHFISDDLVNKILNNVLKKDDPKKMLATVPNKQNVARVLHSITATFNSQFVISTGDSVYPSGLAEFERNGGRLDQVMKGYSPMLLKKDWLSTLGNHDCQGDLDAIFTYGSERNSKWLLKNKDGYYTKTYENENAKFSIKFVVLNACTLVCARKKGSPGWDSRCSELSESVLSLEKERSAQMEWFINELEESKNSGRHEYIVVLGHWPIFSIRGNGPTEILARELRPILVRYPNILAYISGHDHSLQHFQDSERLNLHYLVSGAGGASLHPKQKVDTVQIDQMGIPTNHLPKKVKIFDGFGFMFLCIGSNGETDIHFIGEDGRVIQTKR